MKTKKLSYGMLFFVAFSLILPVMADSAYLRLQDKQYAVIEIEEKDFCQLWYEGLNISDGRLWLYVANKTDGENILDIKRLGLGENHTITIKGTEISVYFRNIVDATTVVFEVKPKDYDKEVSFTISKFPSERPIEVGSYLPAAAVLMVGMGLAAWCVVHGSTIGASATAEKQETSVWGLVLSIAGPIIMIFGFVFALMLIIPEKLGVLAFLAAETLVAAVVLVVTLLGKMRNLAIIFLGIAGTTTAIVLMSGGGGGVMIPAEAWGPLLGAVTMIGAAACAAMCIMAAVKAGSAAMMEKPELSIWSLLFVALGEGLAIYGLIVAILLVMG